MSAVLLACVLLLGVVTSAGWAQAIHSPYIVRSGDSYESIAARHGISLSQLQNLNPSLNLYGAVHVGQSLRVPIGGMYAPSAGSCPRLHIVNPSETLAWIGNVYGVAVRDIAYLNNTNTEPALFAGSALCLPTHARLDWEYTRYGDDDYREYTRYDDDDYRERTRYGDDDYRERTRYGDDDYREYTRYGDDDYRERTRYGDDDYRERTRYGDDDYRERTRYGDDDYRERTRYGDDDYREYTRYGDDDYREYTRYDDDD